MRSMMGSRCSESPRVRMPEGMCSGLGGALPRGALKERRMRSRHLLAAWPACSEQVPVSTR